MGRNNWKLTVAALSELIKVLLVLLKNSLQENVIDKDFYNFQLETKEV